MYDIYLTLTFFISLMCNYQKFPILLSLLLLLRLLGIECSNQGGQRNYFVMEMFIHLKIFLLVYVVGTFKCTFMTSYPYGLSMLVVCDADVAR